MGDARLAIIISLILLIAGGFVYYLETSYSQFNFYESDLAINGSNVKEMLHYLTDEDYHTLYRNFQSYINAPNQIISNSVSITNVNCSAGTSYYNTVSSCYNDNSLIPSSCLPYTEPNEYGCTFGDIYGFNKGKNYWISAEYTVHPENLFKIKNDYYIKFVVYGENRHPKLITGENFMVQNTITDKEYFPDEQVIIYLPYSGNMSKFNIINQQDFEFDDKTWRHVSILLLSLFPGIIFFFSWYFFGRKPSANVPDRLSTYPNKRKASEVAAFFNLPFGSKNSRLISTLLTDFYNRKIIDISLRDKNKKVYIRIAKDKPDSMNKIEKEFMRVLKFFKEHSEKEGEYFLLDASKIKWKERSELIKISSSFSSSIREEKKEFLSENIPIFCVLAMIALLIGAALILSFITLTFIFFSIILVFIVSVTSTLFTKFKKDYYLEYMQWQSFKRFLKSSSLKLHGHKGTIIWGEFLVYATALGVAKKVLEEMKRLKIITEEQYNAYSVICYPYVLSSHTGNFGGSGSGVGGGFGGAGAGGVGGGGGGGR